MLNFFHSIFPAAARGLSSEEGRFCFFFQKKFMVAINAMNMRIYVVMSGGITELFRPGFSKT